MLGSMVVEAVHTEHSLDQVTAPHEGYAAGKADAGAGEIPEHVPSEELCVRLDPKQPNLAASAYVVPLRNVRCKHAH